MTGLDTQVLIVGAGPTGLTAALWLKRLGVDIRIIDKGSGPGDTSRALAVQARTLEFHRQIGIVEDVLSAGVRLNRLTMRTAKGIAAELPLSDFGAGVTRYAFAFALPQDIHERVLLGHLQEAGLTVERQTELVDFEDHGERVTARLRKGDETSLARVDYLVGCDGAHSAVRHGMKLGFPGGTYDQSFYVADVQGHGPVTHEGLDIVLGAYGFALIMPVRQSGSLRLIGVVPKRFEAEPRLTFDMIREDVERESGIKVEAVNWFSSYRVHHRVADRFRKGRVFIAGDAGHIHSPAGGQGMNTGMGDAVNLAWKLAAVLQGRAALELLDSYEPERIAFAHSLIRGTDQAFRLVSGRSWLSDIWRRFVMPNILARLLQTKIRLALLLRTHLANAHQLSRQRLERGQSWKGRGRRSAAMGRKRRRRQFCAAVLARLASACLWRGASRFCGARRGPRFAAAPVRLDMMRWPRPGSRATPPIS